MRWFKHLTTANRDEKLMQLIDELGWEGYGLYFFVLELIAERCTPENNQTFLKFSVKSWRRITNFSPKRFKNFLEICQKIGIFSVKFEDDFITVDCPNILKYRDEWTKKKSKKTRQSPESLRSHSGEAPVQLPPDTETDTETDTEIDIIKLHSPTSARSGGANEGKSSQRSNNGLEPEYLDLATRLAGIVKSQKQIKVGKQRLKSWGKEIRKLHRTDGADMDRISKALDWYAKHIGEQYVPVVESGKAFRDKFLRLEDAMKREARAGPQSSPTKRGDKGFTERNVETSIGALRLLGVDVDENGNVKTDDPG